MGGNTLEGTESADLRLRQHDAPGKGRRRSSGFELSTSPRAGSEPARTAREHVRRGADRTLMRGLSTPNVDRPRDTDRDG